MAAPASDWPKHFRLLLCNRWTILYETWQISRSQRALPILRFSDRSEKQVGRPGVWLAETFWTSPLKPLNGIQRSFTESKIATCSSKFVFFWADLKNRMAARPLIRANFSTSPLKPLNGIQRNVRESKISTCSSKFVFLYRSEEQNCRKFSTSQPMKMRVTNVMY